MPFLYCLLAATAHHDLQYFFQTYGYIGIYIFFVTVDQIAPIPEEISLIVIGYLAANAFFNPVFAGIFALAAFLTIDVIYFYLTKSGNKLLKKITSKADSPAMASYKTKLRKHTLKTLLVIAFIPRVRLFAPVFVALAELPFVRFMAYSSMSLSLFIAVYISIGYVFHNSIQTLVSRVPKAGNVIFIVGMVVLMVVLTVVAFRKFKK